MSLNTRIKERREFLGMSRTELADLIGVTPSAIANYENGISSPKIDLLYKLFEALKCDANYLYQDEMKEFSNDSTTEDEAEIIKKYRSLDSLDKKAISDLLNTLSGRRSDQEEVKAYPPLLYPYYGHIASAGTGQFVFNDVPTDMIEVENTPINAQADFAIGVNGDSMMPTYNDGDVLLVKKQASVNIGEIGIFMIDGEAFVKEFDGSVLKSHNTSYKDIPISSNTICFGKVIGKI